MRPSILAVCGLIILANQPVLAQTLEQPSSGSEGVPGAATPDPRGPKQATIGTARIRHAMRDQVNAGLVSIVSGSMDATDVEEATDLAVGLDGIRDHLRIVPVIGKGASQNVTDIVFARGIDIGIIQLDVLAALKRDPPFPGIENYLRYITKLYDEEVHILARKDIASSEALASRKVNFGMPNSGTQMTANVIFQKLGVSVEATSFPQSIALEKLRLGEISALVYVVGKPARLFQNIRPDENLHFLPITLTNDLSESYAQADLRAEDYPDLIAADGPISTLAIGSVLAVYNWPSGMERHRKVAQFVRAFFEQLHELQVPPHHPKWREVDVAASVPGWTRFAAAQDWIGKTGLDIDDRPRDARLHEAVPHAEAKALSPQDRTALFSEFADYQKRQPHASSAGLRDPQQREALFTEFIDYQRQTHNLSGVEWLDPPHREALFTEFVSYRKRQVHTVSSSTGLLDPQQREVLFTEFVGKPKR
jgi:uncharacterized protein